MSRPDLNPEALDGLLWFLRLWEYDFLDLSDNTWDCFEDTSSALVGMASPCREIPKPVLDDMWAGFEYLRKVIAYNLAKGTLTLKSDLTLRECQYWYSVAGYLDDVKTLTRSRHGKPRMPVMPRKRANGLWWVLAVSDCIKEFGDEFPTVCNYGQMAEDGMASGYHAGETVVKRLAMYHETKYPTAPRTIK